MPALLLFVAATVQAAVPAPSHAEHARWERQARAVTIVRDDWGIPHVRGRTDADAVFGMIYAQAEDDFNRIETNYLTALGRLAEAEGESAIWQHVRMKLFSDESLPQVHPDGEARMKYSPCFLLFLWGCGKGRRHAVEYCIDFSLGRRGIEAEHHYSCIG